MEKNYIVELVRPVEEGTLQSAVLQVAGELDIGQTKLTRLLSRGPGVLTKPTTKAKADKVVRVLRGAGIDVLVTRLALSEVLLLPRGEEAPPNDTPVEAAPPLSYTHEADLLAFRDMAEADATRPPSAPLERRAVRRGTGGQRTALTIIGLVALAAMLMLVVPSATGLLQDEAPADASGSRDTSATGLVPFDAGADAFDRGDYAGALAIWLPLAELGDVRSQQWVGTIYREGRGVDADPVEAVRWYRLAADQGQSEAQFQMGVLAYDGSGVAQDAEQAAQWFSLAAAQGHAEAQFNLGVLYLRGEGVARSIDQAQVWLQQASEQGLSEATDLLESIETRFVEVDGEGGPLEATDEPAADEPAADEPAADEPAAADLAVATIPRTALDAVAAPPASGPGDAVRAEAAAGVPTISPNEGGNATAPERARAEVDIAVAAEPAASAEGASAPPVEDAAATPTIVPAAVPTAVPPEPVAAPAGPTPTEAILLEGPLAIFRVAREGTPAQLATVLSAGASVFATDEYGQTPLMYAAGTDDAAMVRALVAAGSEINARSGAGWTALMYATRDSGDPDVIATLLENGADPSVVNSDGETAEALARRFHPALVAVLAPQPEARP